MDKQLEHEMEAAAYLGVYDSIGSGGRGAQRKSKGKLLHYLGFRLSWWVRHGV